MDIFFQYKLMIICNLSILHMYNEIRNTSEDIYFDKNKEVARLGKRMEAMERMLCEIKRLRTLYSIGKGTLVEGEVYNAVLAAITDSFKSDVFSPYGFCSTLCMLLQITEGEIKESFLNILKTYGFRLDESFYHDMKNHISSLTNIDVQPGVKNLLCHDKRQKIYDYIERCKKIFRFKCEKDSNSSENVSNKFMRIINALFRNKSLFSPERPLFLINSVYFKGEWLNKFNPEHTSMKKFYNKDKTSKVSMMKQKNIFHVLYKNKLHFLRIDLKDFFGVLCLVIVLPDKNFYIPEQLLLEFKIEFRKLISGDCTIQNVDLELPKFEIETECNLNKVLNTFFHSDLMDKEFKLNSSFSPYDIIKMNIKHKTTIEFNESGICTEETNLQNESFLNDKHSINYFCNRPFVFYLFDIRKLQVKSDENLETPFFPVVVGRYTGPNN
ncbi:serpin-type proteinase inhibitor 20 [Vairimorpha necatrix]|uniref:Serpin-type proteinase inhibitor 20 n=1 Tax=Vairimorpha necatrix TaxID=6039 RepID=A0AAX4JEF0_9MICR